MPHSFGISELLLLAVLAIPVAVLYVRRHRHYRSGIALVVCAALAALLTPADIVSMVVFLTAFAGMFLFGSRYGLEAPTAAA